MIGALAQGKQINIAALHSASLAGTIMASFTVEDFSVKRLVKLKAAEIRERHQIIKNLVKINAWKLRILNKQAILLLFQTE